MDLHGVVGARALEHAALGDALSHPLGTVEAGRRGGRAAPPRTDAELTIGTVWPVARWLKRRRWIRLGDGSDSRIQVGWDALAAQATLITRLRLDARLFASPEPVPAGRRDPKPKKGGFRPSASIACSNSSQRASGLAKVEL
ncbi:MAG: hypothetical protein AADX96_16685 [Thiocapsa sp. C3-sup]|uniref:hypothetical protein n=1 Tax=Thiocapsa sp. C3-sup TaxID=3137396 RepID=UPI0035B01C13